MRIIPFTLSLFLSAFTTAAVAQVTTVYPSTVNVVPIPDGGCVDSSSTGVGLGGISNSITIPGGDAGAILDVNVQVQVTTTWRSDLQMALTDGTTTVQLAHNQGSTSINYYATFDSAVATNCGDSTFCGDAGNCVTAPGPVCGPNQSLDGFNGPEAASREFTLQICDTVGGAPPTLQNWSLQVTRGSAAEPRATFAVSKVFTDGNPSEVDVTLSCNTGLILDQTKTISAGSGVVFVVTDYADGALNCELTEEPVAGYNASYFDGSSTNSTGCVFQEVPFGGYYTCVVTNEPAPVDIVVTKEWNFEGPSSGNGISQEYELTLWCDAEIVGGYNPYEMGLDSDSPSGLFSYCGSNPTKKEGPQLVYYDWCKTYYGEGPGLFTSEVIPEYPGSNCYVTEYVYDAGVEIENGCNDLSVSAGQGDSCTITNTVFYEGIPTLNQYGLMMLALLMLGAGFIGFRRFV
ncbi:MAG: IPTL-CTERM sorting domain-containing protein [Xanthomonadales bacterium]|nr:IPTL-CTERM sorting domain-containing protein [Xanthomonadales bacterium]